MKTEKLEEEGGGGARQDDDNDYGKDYIINRGNRGLQIIPTGHWSRVRLPRQRQRHAASDLSLLGRHGRIDVHAAQLLHLPCAMIRDGAPTGLSLNGMFGQSLHREREREREGGRRDGDRKAA